MKKAKQFIMWSLIFVLCFTFIPSFAAASADTLASIENEVADYLSEAHPDIELHSPDYVSYLSKQLMFEDDEQLADRLSNYENFTVYAGEYLREAEGIPSHQTFEGLPADTLRKSIDEIQNELSEKREQIEAEVQSMRSDDIATYEMGFYNPYTAARYAQTYAEIYNKNYEKYSSDCTNFVSQCLVAGGATMKEPYPRPADFYETTEYWYQVYCDSGMRWYDTSTSWMRVEDFYKYFAGHRYAETKYASSKADLCQKAQIGDIVQLSKDNGRSYYHSIIISAGSGNNLKFCSHTDDVKDKLVTELRDVNNYFRIIRPYYA